MPNSDNNAFQIHGDSLRHHPIHVAMLFKHRSWDHYVVSLTEIITNVDEVDLIMFNSISKSNTKKAIKIILMLFS